MHSHWTFLYFGRDFLVCFFLLECLVVFSDHLWILYEDQHQSYQCGESREEADMIVPSVHIAITVSHSRTHCFSLELNSPLK